MTNTVTLPSRLRDVASSGPGRVAIEDDQGRVTYGDLLERARRVAAAIERRKWAGARIGLYASPGAPWVTGFLGTLLAGGSAVALSPSYPPPELRFLVDSSNVRGVLTSRDLEASAAGALGGVPTLNVDEAALPGVPVIDRIHEPQPGDVALVLFTSGTTGKPKGARLTHENVLALSDVLGEAWGFGPNDTLLHTLPLHHLHGIGVSLIVALVAGAKTRFVRFEPRAVWEALGGATVFMGVPTQHKKLFDAFDVEDEETRRRWTAHGKALRLVTSGSAALPEPVGQRWRALSGAYPLERYGMTEIGIVLSNPLAGERRPGTVGKPLRGVDLRVVAESGSDAEPDEPGELWIRARTVFAGYDGRGSATRDAFSGGWFKTGDTVSMSKDGYVKVLGRTSIDILKSGGYKISALEIEHVLREHEDVGDVAVVGMPDEIWGDLVVAAVVERPGRGISEEPLRAWAKERIAPYKVPKRIAVVPDLPRNALGKVQKNVLVRMLLERGMR